MSRSRGYPVQGPHGGGSHQRPPPQPSHGGYSGQGRGNAPNGGSSSQSSDNFVDAGPLRTLVNLFQITSLPTSKYFQYTDIEPKIFNRARRSEIVDRLQNHTSPELFRRPAVFDGRSILYSAVERLRLPDGAQTFIVRMSDGARSKEFSVTLTLVDRDGVDVGVLKHLLSDKSSNPANQQLAIQPTNIVNLLVRAAPNLAAAGRGMDVHQVRGARMYLTDVGKQFLGEGLEIWQGYFQSARPAIGQMLLNIDTATAAMVMSGPLQRVAAELLQESNPRRLASLIEGDAKFRKLSSFLKKIFVVIDMKATPQRPPEPNSRKKQIIGIMSASKLASWTFRKDDQDITVKMYYKDVYNINLVNTPFAILTGSLEKPAIFPAEFCWIVPGQFYKKKLSAEQNKIALKFTTKAPAARLQAIRGGIGVGNEAELAAPAIEYKNSPVIRTSGMAVSSQPLEIQGQILRTPRLQFNSEMLTPRNGAWNLKYHKVHKATSHMKKWIILDLATTDTNLRNNFVHTLLGCLQGRGIEAAPPAFLAGAAGAAQKLLNEAKQAGCVFVLVILPQSAEEIRNNVKHYGDIVYGIATQCVKVNKLYQADDQYCNNLVLKINARLRGTNSIPITPDLVQLRSQPFMIFGMDVAHPPPGVRNSPSVASVVHSIDDSMTNYAALSGVQEPGEEIIVDLEAMLHKAFARFLKENKTLPWRLIFFRDGVSEGQFEEVCQREISVIGKVIQAWQGDYFKAGIKRPPRVTFVVVRKRHHVRFFPIGGRGADRKGNVQAGFVAEEGLKSPFHRDFFLLSHGGLLGTSRPSHYTVLKDECFHDHPVILQDLAYALCHSYAAATRSVSIVAPIYYADNVCERAKFHYPPYSDLQSNTSDETFNLSYWKGLYQPLNPDMANTMYFV